MEILNFDSFYFILFYFGMCCVGMVELWRPPASCGPDHFGKIIFLTSMGNFAKHEFVKQKSHHLEW